jgi:hypothetical protein
LYNYRHKKHWPSKRFEYDPKKLSIIAFGDGMKNKDQVHFKGHRVGLVGTLERELKNRQKNGNCLVADAGEFKTSKV